MTLMGQRRNSPRKGMGNKLGLLNIDLKSNDSYRRDSNSRPLRNQLILIAIFALLAIIAAAAFWATKGNNSSFSSSEAELANYNHSAETAATIASAQSLSFSDNLDSESRAPNPVAPDASTATSKPDDPAIGYVTDSTVVANGDSLLGVFERLGLNVSQWYSLRDLGPDVQRLTTIRPGDVLDVVRTEDGNLIRLTYQYSLEKSLTITSDEHGYAADILHNPIERDIVSASGVITDSFYLSAKRSGLEDKQIMELAELFAWDINFALDVWEGDSFAVLYEKLSQDGQFIGYGDIVAAEFHNRQREIQTIRFTDDNGEQHYYTPEGRSMRRAFLQSPVHFTRISSGFSLARLHPIHKTKRPHRGVDYAAPKGTKIMASGDGVVEFIGRQNGFGQTVILRHGKRYTTLYAHMSRFAKLRKGARVKQGQTIGYVGKTGAATGDHLHYEFRVNGQHKNPLTVKLPPAAPIGDEYREEFIAQAEPLLGWLDSLSDKGPAIAGSSDNSVAAPAR